MSKHTKGPYEATEGGFIYAVVNDAPTWCIGKAYPAPSNVAAPASAMESNAKLFAASWDLLAACKMIEAYDSDEDASGTAFMLDYADAIAAVRAAIAKASAP